MNVFRLLLPAAVSVLVSAVAVAPRAAHAAPIVWGNATNISGAADVSTQGSLIAAYNFGRTADNGNPAVSSATVNGVTFAPFAIMSFMGGNPTTVGNFTISETPGQLFSDNTAFGSTQAPFANLPAGYQTLLQSGVSSATSATITLTMSNLVVGQTYQYQWWANTSGPTALAANFVTATAGNSVTLMPNPSGTNGGLGQFAIGVFTADSSTQTVSYDGVTSRVGPVLNGFQLRNVSGAGTGAPEPSSLLLIVFGATGAAAKAGRFLTARRRAKGVASQTA